MWKIFVLLFSAMVQCCAFYMVSGVSKKESFISSLPIKIKSYNEPQTVQTIPMDFTQFDYKTNFFCYGNEFYFISVCLIA